MREGGIGKCLAQRPSSNGGIRIAGVYASRWRPFIGDRPNLFRLFIILWLGGRVGERRSRPLRAGPLEMGIRGGYLRYSAGRNSIESVSAPTALWQSMQNLTLADPLALVVPTVAPFGMISV